jgi:hypothetical protein
MIDAATAEEEHAGTLVPIYDFAQILHTTTYAGDPAITKEGALGFWIARDFQRLYLLRVISRRSATTAEGLHPHAQQTPDHSCSAACPDQTAARRG